MVDLEGIIVLFTVPLVFGGLGILCFILGFNKGFKGRLWEKGQVESKDTGWVEPIKEDDFDVVYTGTGHDGENK